jgi:hypothetical protein
VEQLLSHWAEHDLNHIEQIRSALSTAGQRNAVSR